MDSIIKLVVPGVRPGRSWRSWLAALRQASAPPMSSGRPPSTACSARSVGFDSLPEHPPTWEHNPRVAPRNRPRMVALPERIVERVFAALATTPSRRSIELLWNRRSDCTCGVRDNSNVRMRVLMSGTFVVVMATAVGLATLSSRGPSRGGGRPTGENAVQSEPLRVRDAVTRDAVVLIPGALGGAPPCATGVFGDYDASAARPERAPLRGEVALPNGQRWALCGASGVFSSELLSLRSDDNGTTWRVAATPMALSPHHAGDSVDVALTTTSDGRVELISAVAPALNAVFTTNDGGATWTRQ